MRYVTARARRHGDALFLFLLVFFGLILILHTKIAAGEVFIATLAYFPGPCKVF